MRLHCAVLQTNKNIQINPSQGGLLEILRRRGIMQAKILKENMRQWESGASKRKIKVRLVDSVIYLWVGKLMTWVWVRYTSYSKIDGCVTQSGSSSMRVKRCQVPWLKVFLFQNDGCLTRSGSSSMRAKQNFLTVTQGLHMVIFEICLKNVDF